MMEIKTTIAQGDAYLGIDIGGQSLKGIRVESDGRIAVRAQRRTPIGSRDGAQAVLNTLRDLVDELLRPGPVRAVGAGTPGAVDASGVIAGEAVNIPGWKGTALGAELARLAHAPAMVRNDGNLAAYAEWALRAGASECLLFIGLGTGIGGGFIERGRIVSGMDDKAVEIGHVIVFPDGRACACGVAGCVEAYAAGPSIGRLAFDMAHEKNAATGDFCFGSPLAVQLRAQSGSKATADAAAAGAAGAIGPGPPNAVEVYRAFALGDALSIAVDDIVTESLARVCATALALYAPDCVVFGGGVLRGAAHLVDAVAQRVKPKVYAAAQRGCRFEAALCGHEAGLAGAALCGAATVLAREEVYRLALALQTRQ